MSLIPPLPVADPVRSEAEDAVIKEARRRARRRRWRYGGVLAVLLGLVAAACVPWNAESSPQVSEPPDFTGLPPADAVPSTPLTGELVAEIPTEHTRIWVYADGRMVTMHMYGSTENSWPNTGFREQHLTPSGVELLRSYVLDHTGGGASLVEETQPVEERGRDVRVQMGDGKLYRRSTTYPSSWWRCHWDDCERYVSSLDSLLPASAWADQTYRRYVARKFWVCYRGQPAGGTDGEFIPAGKVRMAMPIEARALLTAAPTIPAWGTGVADPDTEARCATVNLDAARAIDAALRTAGYGPPEQHVAPVYEFTIPAGEEGVSIAARVSFLTVLPNGDAEGPGA